MRPYLILAVLFLNAITQAKGNINVPAFAAIAGIRVGLDTMELLEQKIGNGSVTMGGHSHGGREWQFKQSGWYLYADGFYYDDAGRRVIDTISIELDAPHKKIPYANLSRKRMLFMGVISPGMKRDEILRLLRGKLAQPKIVDNSLLWMGKGAVSFNTVNHYKVAAWKATLSFEGEILHRIFIEAEID
jgi:hypothetical protein